jgi:lambda family phage minor tail protein L
MTVRADEQRIDPSGKVILYELDATSIGGPLYRFTANLKLVGQPVVWQGNTYIPWAIKEEGFEWSGQGTIPRPTLAVSNYQSLISGLILTYADLVGAKVTRKMTLVKYLDAVNFPGGVNPTADPNAYWPDEIFFVNRKINEDKNSVTFELVSSFDLEGVKLPRRYVVQNVCLWKYRSAECGYAGGPVATTDDVPTSDPNLDDCGLRVSSCKLRFGATSPLPFGGFPSVGLTNPR